MKNKGLQPRLLYPARLSIKMEGQIRSFPDKKGSKNTPPPIQHCKICLRDCFKKMKEKSEREQNTGTKGKNGNDQVLINNNPKCKWIKCSNQKT